MVMGQAIKKCTIFVSLESFFVSKVTVNLFEVFEVKFYLKSFQIRSIIKP